MRLSVVTLFVKDQDEARKFYVEKLGFCVAEDKPLGDYRWLLVRSPDSAEVAISLELARTPEEVELVGRQGGGQALFGLVTDNCRRDYSAMKTRGVTFEGEPTPMPYGTGVLLHDLYGNRVYLNEEPRG